MASPRLSICIPTYGRAALLSATLSHLLENCGPDAEVVVSDNGSPDDTPRVIAEFGARFRHFRTIRHGSNVGAFANLSASLLLATGKYCYSLSDDDEIVPAGLEAAMRLLDDVPDIAGVYGGYQEWDRATGATRTFAGAQGRMDFARGDKASIMRRFALLWFPVCRTEVLQRFFTYDDRSFGSWPLVGTLLEHGGISVIPDVLYKHAQTEPRMEYELTESWYHDGLRSQFEVYFGRMGPGNRADLGHFIQSRVGPAYLQGFRFAMIKNELLKARHFLLRARAYGLVDEAEVAVWEQGAIVAMVAERLRNQIALLPEVREVLFEDAAAVRSVQTQFFAVRGSLRVNAISTGAWFGRAIQPDQFLVTRLHIDDRKADPARKRAVLDLVENCRLTSQDLEPFL